MTLHPIEEHTGDRYRDAYVPVPQLIAADAPRPNLEAKLFAAMMLDAYKIGQLKKRTIGVRPNPPKQPLTSRQENLLKAVRDFGGPVRTVDLVGILGASSSSIGTGLSNLRARGLVVSKMSDRINFWTLAGAQAGRVAQ